MEEVQYKCFLKISLSKDVSVLELLIIKIVTVSLQWVKKKMNEEEKMKMK